MPLTDESYRAKEERVSLTRLSYHKITPYTDHSAATRRAVSCSVSRSSSAAIGPSACPFAFLVNADLIASSGACHTLGD